MWDERSITADRPNSLPAALRGALRCGGGPEIWFRGLYASRVSVHTHFDAYKGIPHSPSTA